ncbi:DNA-methyltransferase [Methylobacterium phyllosphaerae]
MSQPVLLRGDCHDLIKTLPDNSVDLILTDPPYGTTAAKWDKKLDYTQLWVEYERVLKPTGVCLIFSAQPFTSMLIASNPKYYRNIWYWRKNRKTGFLRTGQQPMRCIEEICVFGRTPESATYNPQMRLREKPVVRNRLRKAGKLYKPTPAERWVKGEVEDRVYTHYHPDHLLEFDAVPHKDTPVETQKPVDLLRYLIRTYSNPGELVLDPTMGAGSTSVAALEEGRAFVGFEFSAKHYDIAVQRIEGDELRLAAE